MSLVLEERGGVLTGLAIRLTAMVMLEKSPFLRLLAFSALTGLFTPSCSGIGEPVIVKRSYQDNYIVQKILVGYYSLESLPKERLEEAKQKLQKNIACPDYMLLEDGLSDITRTYTSYDSFLKTSRTHEYVKIYYWQKYRCRSR